MISLSRSYPVLSAKYCLLAMARLCQKQENVQIAAETWQNAWSTTEIPMVLEPPSPIAPTTSQYPTFPASQPVNQQQQMQNSQLPRQTQVLWQPLPAIQATIGSSSQSQQPVLRHLLP
jgi:hypothetical protein